MRKAFFALPLVAAPFVSGCASTSSFVESDAALGRIVVYRNGVAYYERTAEVDGDTLELKVPADKVDDFLKSLTVLDAETKKAAPIAYPTRPGSTASADGTIAMKVQLTDGDRGPRRLLLTYVTEAPSWKPSYRVVLGKDGQVKLLGWAIVDNTSGEDWKDVKLGVGSSSALSFRFDLVSIRNVQRETLSPEHLFAQAPPTGLPIDDRTAGGQPVLGVVDEDTIARSEMRARDKAGADVDKMKSEEHARHLMRAAPPRATAISKGPTKPEDPVAGAAGDRRGTGNLKPADAQPAPDPVASLARQLQGKKRRVIVEGLAGKGDADKNASALERANRLREQLIQNGVSPDQIVAVANLEVQGGEAGGARVVEAPVATAFQTTGAAESAAALEPIGTSHFESKAPMTVPAGTSAMVSILDATTGGEVVYLYDPESPRGNKTYAFKSVRLKNPTDSTLETGPVTVYGDGRFIGEGFTDPIPGKSTSFVPFALDRQIVIEEKAEESDGIAKLLTAQRGVFSAEMRHTKKKKLTITNRLDKEAVVYVRHTVRKGFKLAKFPGEPERLGEAHLFRLKVPARGKIDVSIEEETPVFRTVDLRSTEGIDLIRAYVSNAALEGDLAKRVDNVVGMQKDLGTLEERIETAREQMEEYRQRMNELHAQLVTLKAVKTAGPLMKSLEKKLEEVSDKLSKATVDLVALEEQRMIAKIKLQDSIAELSFDKPGEGKLAKGAP
jgi:hypothetical protein